MLNSFSVSHPAEWQAEICLDTLFQLLLCQDLVSSTDPRIRTWLQGCRPYHTVLNLPSSKSESSWFHCGGNEEVLLFFPFSTFPFIQGFCSYGYISMPPDTNGAVQHIKVLGLFHVSVGHSLRFSWAGFSLAPWVKCLLFLKENFHIRLCLLDWVPLCKIPYEAACCSPAHFTQMTVLHQWSTTIRSITAVAVPQQLAEPVPSLTTAEQFPAQI